MDRVWDVLARPALNLSFGLVGAIVLSLLMMRYLPDVPLFNKMVMSGELATGNSSDATGLEGAHLGMKGVTTTDLRPAGKGEFDGQVLDITAAIVFDLNTPGGFAWETSEFLMQDLARAKSCIKNSLVSQAKPPGVFKSNTMAAVISSTCPSNSPFPAGRKSVVVTPFIPR